MPRDTKNLPIEPRDRIQQMAARAEAVSQIEAMLKDGPATVGDIFQVVDGLRSTIVGYLRYMHKTLRTAHPTGQKRGGSTLWEHGPDPTLPTLDEELDQLIAAKRGWRPAQQVGMHRDPLVAALFGPAQN